MGKLKFEVTWWWEPIWIPLATRGDNEKMWNYRYFTSIVFEPFLNNFWFELDDVWFAESIDVFQSQILIPDLHEFKEYLDKKWYEVVWRKVLSFKIKKQWNKEILVNYEESWDDFEMKIFLEKVKDWELSFWFLPWDNKWELIVIFAKPKKVYLWDSVWSGVQNTRQEVSWLLEDKPKDIIIDQLNTFLNQRNLKLLKLSDLQRNFWENNISANDEIDPGLLWEYIKNLPDNHPLKTFTL